MKQPTLYLIPGLAADHYIFSNLKLDKDYTVRYLDWLDPLDGESIDEYAQRFSEQINTAEPFVLIGVSMGGIMSIVMSKYCAPEKVIIISSAKQKEEVGGGSLFVTKFPLHRWASYNTIKKSMILFVRLRHGRKKANEFGAMLDRCTEKFFRWATDKMKDLGDQPLPQGLFHIHGTRDHVFPFRRIKGAIPVKGGTHFMILENAEEVEQIVRKILNNELPPITP